MDQRTKRLAGLILIYAAKIIGVLFGILVAIVLVVMLFGENAPAALGVLLCISMIAFFSFMIAKDKLDDLERDEKRVMDRMRRDD